jgi:hypothetical protein
MNEQKLIRAISVIRGDSFVSFGIFHRPCGNLLSTIFKRSNTARWKE